MILRLRSALRIVAEPLRREIADEEMPPPRDVYRSVAEMYGRNAPPPGEDTS
jgi:hypothetical protein